MIRHSTGPGKEDQIFLKSTKIGSFEVFSIVSNNSNFSIPNSKFFLYLCSPFLKTIRVMADLIKVVEQEYAKVREGLPAFKAGDTVNVHVKIKEGSKERIQQFQGVVIQRRGSNTNGETFTVRKISNGVGVERIFPTASPSIDKIEVVKEGRVRRAKLYYMKGRQGKSARIKEKV
jgi:large subunit ribosomal protein L19